eukprot:Nk52_evm53s1737 gene=Nk52_evmTU53s1737
MNEKERKQNISKEGDNDGREGGNNNNEMKTRSEAPSSDTLRPPSPDGAGGGSGNQYLGRSASVEALGDGKGDNTMLYYMQDNASDVVVRGKRLRVTHIGVKKNTETEADGKGGEGEDERPVLFFIHGFGGCTEQWRDQVCFYMKRVPLVLVDLVGHGESEKPEDSTVYSTDSIVKDLECVFHEYKGAKNVLFGHSYGTTLAAKLYQWVGDEVNSVVLISPTLAETSNAPRWPLLLPSSILDMLRKLDRRGGINSNSVNKMLHPSASEKLREMQLRWNSSNPSWVVKHLGSNIELCNLQEYAQIKVPTLLLCGSGDKVTPPENARLIENVIMAKTQMADMIPDAGHMVMLEQNCILNAIVDKFLIEKGGFEALSRLHKLNRGNSVNDKWSLKNYKKWANIQRNSTPVGKKGFVGMKVMRQEDETHSPLIFHQRNPNVGAVIDLSSADPSYDTSDKALRKYIKVATVSKIVPPQDRVDEFVRTADKFWNENPGKYLAVHCHYGFNRTGFMICSYLIEKENYTVQEAIDEYAKARPPGIKHQHFKDELFIRYTKFAK